LWLAFFNSLSLDKKPARHRLPLVTFRQSKGARDSRAIIAGVLPRWRSVWMRPLVAVNEAYTGRGTEVNKLPRREATEPPD
jgi:hypothetical protein